MTEAKYLQKRAALMNELLKLILEPKNFGWTENDVLAQFNLSQWELKALLKEFNFLSMENLIQQLQYFQVTANEPSLFGFQKQKIIDSNKHLRITLVEYREPAQIQFAYLATRFGKCFGAWNEAGHLIQLTFEDAENGLERLKKAYPIVEINHNGDLGEAELEVLNGNFTNYDFKLCLKGSDFQIKVWNELILTEAGSTKYYIDIARKLGDENACRAVGTAVGANPIAWFVPCHRVLHASNKIGNFRWKTWRKRLFLALEN